MNVTHTLVAIVPGKSPDRIIANSVMSGSSPSRNTTGRLRTMTAPASRAAASRPARLACRIPQRMTPKPRTECASVETTTRTPPRRAAAASRSSRSSRDGWALISRKVPVSAAAAITASMSTS